MTRIQGERRLMEGAQAVRRATTNQEVVRQAESGIRESQRRIAYYEDTLMQLRSKAQQRNSSSSGGGSNATGAPSANAATMYDGSSTHGSTTSGYPGDSSASYTTSSGSFDSTRRPGYPADGGDKGLPPAPDGPPDFYDNHRAGSPGFQGPGPYGGYPNNFRGGPPGGPPPGGMMRPMQGPPYGAQPGWNPGMPVARMGTTVGKKAYTNLGRLHSLRLLFVR